MSESLISHYVPSGGDGSSIVQSYGLLSPAYVPEENPLLQKMLRVACMWGSGVTVFVSGLGPCFPHVGTSPSVFDARAVWSVPQGTLPQASQAEREVLALSVAEQARELLAALCMNKSQLSAMLHITRPTLYDWLDGKEPKPANAERIAVLLRLLAGAGVTSAKPLQARFVRQSLEPGSPSLLDLLGAEVLDENQVSAMLSKAKDLGEKAESRRLEREASLRARGFEEPTQEQRREQLAKNVAMRSWPKTER